MRSCFNFGWFWTLDCGLFSEIICVWFSCWIEGVNLENSNLCPLRPPFRRKSDFSCCWSLTIQNTQIFLNRASFYVESKAPILLPSAVAAAKVVWRPNSKLPRLPMCIDLYSPSTIAARKSIDFRFPNRVDFWLKRFPLVSSIFSLLLSVVVARKVFPRPMAKLADWKFITFPPKP